MSEERQARGRATSVIQEAVLELQRALASGSEDYRTAVVRYGQLFVAYLDAMQLIPEYEPLLRELVRDRVLKAWELEYPGKLLPLDGGDVTASRIQVRLRQAVREMLMEEVGEKLLDESELDEEVEFRVCDLLFKVALAIFRMVGELR